MKNTGIRVCLLSQLILVAACSSGGGGGGVLNAPVANVEGVWSVSYTNTGQAVFTGCDGYFGVLNGLTAQFVFSLGPSCSAADPMVEQNDEAFTVHGQSYWCTDGSTWVSGGGGTVTGDSVRGQLDAIDSAGTIGTDFFTGTVNGDAINLSKTRFEIRGSHTGSCQISPPLRASGFIIRDKSSTSGTPSLAASALVYLMKVD